MTSNLKIWDSVKATDPNHTKAFSQNGGGTSINGTYMEMRATELFGPKGIGWGVRVMEERFDKGAPVMQKVKDAAGQEVQVVVPDGSGGYLCEINHTVRITLWFNHDGKNGEIEAYGCTPYLYKSKYGMTSDGEAPKKSLTDAMKKALSGLGFSADIFLGLYDIAAYVDETRAAFGAQNEIKAIEDKQKVFDDFVAKITANATTISTSLTKSEANSVSKKVLLEISTNLRVFGGDQEKAAKLNALAARVTEVTKRRVEEIEQMKKKPEAENGTDA